MNGSTTATPSSVQRRVLRVLYPNLLPVANPYCSRFPVLQPNPYCLFPGFHVEVS